MAMLLKIMLIVLYHPSDDIMVIMLKLASTTKQHYVIKDEVDNIISSH